MTVIPSSPELEDNRGYALPTPPPVNKEMGHKFALYLINRKLIPREIFQPLSSSTSLDEWKNSKNSRSVHRN